MPTLGSATLTTGDDWTVTVAPPNAKNAVVVVSNAGVYMSLAPGSWYDELSGRVNQPSEVAITTWNPAEPLVPMIHYLDDEPLLGIRFRSRATGVPAVVDVTYTN